MSAHAAPRVLRRWVAPLLTSAVVGAVLAASWVATTPAPPPTVSTVLAAGADDPMCEDYDTQAQAQAAYLAAGGLAVSPFGVDPYGLDPDADGQACEELIDVAPTGPAPLTAPGPFDPTAPAK